MPRGSIQMRQVLSAAAVTLSLVFVGLEVRQNTTAQRAQTRQQLSDGSRELTLAIGDDAETALAFYGWWTEPRDTSLTAGDTLQAKLLMHAWLRNAENVFLQAQEKVVAENVFESYGFVSGLFGTSVFQVFWEAERRRFNSDFVVAFQLANGLQ